MRGLRIVHSALIRAALWSLVKGDYIWPNEKTDELENLLYEQQGFRSENFGFFVRDCKGSGGFGVGGRSFGAEWLRNAYHDMATADVTTGIGGLDASIVFETDRAENPGKAFVETLTSLNITRSTRKTMSDLFALGAVLAMASCSNGAVSISLRAGRTEATGPGPSGVPEPQQDLESHTASFARQGFNATEMIALVACGHSIGGVHGVDFPEIVPIFNNNTDVDDNVIAFDTSTDNFDNTVAKEFVGNMSQNPLAFGPNETTRSDFRIFNADGGGMISQLAASQKFFFETCTTLFERMIDTVPRGVTLSDVIEVVPVKPRSLSMAVNPNGTITVSVQVRIAETLFASSNRQVLMRFAPRLGASSTVAESLPVAIGTTAPNMIATCLFPNCGPNLIFYDFEAVIPASQGVSSFTVEILDTSTGASTLYDNGGHGFPLSDAIQTQLAYSQLDFVWNPATEESSDQLNLTVAILNAEQFTGVTLNVPYTANATSDLSPWSIAAVPLSPLRKVDGTNYTLYNGIYQSNPKHRRTVHPYDVVATGPTANVSSLYNTWNLIPVGEGIVIPSPESNS